MKFKRKPAFTIPFVGRSVSSVSRPHQSELDDEFDRQYLSFLKSGISTPEQYYRLRSFWVWKTLAEQKDLVSLRHDQSLEEIVSGSKRFSGNASDVFHDPHDSSEA